MKNEINKATKFKEYLWNKYKDIQSLKNERNHTINDKLICL